MRILINNKATEDNTTVNEVTTAFPVSYMYSNTLIEKTYFEDYIDIDLGQAEDVDSIAIVGSDGAYILQANSVPASWGTPAYQTTLTEEVTFISETYRYWRINKAELFTAPANTAYTSSGYDVYLNAPPPVSFTGFYPMALASSAPSEDIELAIGTYIWDGPDGTTHPSGPWLGDGCAYMYRQSGAYGAVKYGPSDTIYAGANPSYNGLKTIVIDDNNKFQYYFDSDAFWNAYGEDTSEILIAQNGSVFVTDYTNANMVVRWDGVIGNQGVAGGNSVVDTARPFTDIYSIATGNSKINYFYLGEYMQLDGQAIGSTPQPTPTDIVNKSNMGVIEQTEGILIDSQSFNFPYATESEWSTFDAWYRTSDRINPHFIVPFQDDTPIEGYFANIFNYNIVNRDKLVYNYGFDIEEAK